VQDSCRNGASVATDIYFQTVEGCSDFTDTNCIIISKLIVYSKLITYLVTAVAMLSTVVQVGMETNVCGDGWDGSNFCLRAGL